MEGNFETALKVGKPVARQAQNAGKAHLASECPLAGAHIVQGMERIADGQAAATQSRHPIELLAQAYGL
jgi:glycerol-3-phosphate dehydrogenase subunit C